MSRPLSPGAKVRLWGALFTGIGLLFIKLFVLDPLERARAGAAPAALYLKAVVAAPFFILLGLLLIVVGAPRAPRAGSVASRFVSGEGRASRLEPAGYVCVVILIGLGLGLYLLLKSELARLGFS